jgi:hypothetical protein
LGNHRLYPEADRLERGFASKVKMEAKIVRFRALNIQQISRKTDV